MTKFVTCLLLVCTIVPILYAEESFRKKPIQVEGLVSTDIVIHILATAKHVKYKEGKGTYDYFTNRVIPTAQTWGRSFPHLTFVLGGTDKFEVDITNHGHDNVLCEPVNDTADFQNTFHSICPGFEVLRFSHCTNEYYGSKGPCCRNQESMRWVLKKHMDHLKWYAFMDDDMYIRPLAFIALLSKLNHRKIAVCNAPSTRGFAPGMWKWLGDKGCDSANMCVYAFPWMQPAFFSFQAMQQFQNAIEINGLTKECDAFHVTHDVGLGIFNWMHSIPTLMLPHGTIGDISRMTQISIEDTRKKLAQIISIHAIRRNSGNKTMGKLGGPSGVDGFFASFQALHNFYTQIDTDHPGIAIQIGFSTAQHKVLHLNGFNSTLIKRQAAASDNPYDFRVFTPDDCHDVDFDHARQFCQTKPDLKALPSRSNSSTGGTHHKGFGGRHHHRPHPQQRQQERRRVLLLEEDCTRLFESSNNSHFIHIAASMMMVSIRL